MDATGKAGQAGPLVVAPNWLGDCVMALPALALCADRDGEVLLASKPGLHAFWGMASLPCRLLAVETGARGLWRTAARYRAVGVREAIVLPRSWRATLAPWLARCPRRRGWADGEGGCLLTEGVAPGARHEHQSREVARLLGVDPDALAAPCLRPDAASMAEAESLLAGDTAWVALLPGAARGRSKRWPAAHFAEAGRMLAGAGFRPALFGSVAERELCREIAAAIGAAALDCSARTALPVLAAALARCRAAIGNDSGGTHLAAAVGTRVVAIFGATDPVRTAPLGAGHIVLCEGDPATVGRAIARRDAAAEAALARIAPGRVVAAVRELAP